MHSDLYGGFWLLTRYDDVTAAALDHESFTSAVVGTTIIPPSQPRTDPLLPIELDPPEHTLYRGARQRALREAAHRGAAPGARGARDAAARADRAQRRRRRRWPSSRTRCRSARSRGFMNLPEEDEERWFDWVERMFSNALLDKDDQARGRARRRGLHRRADRRAQGGAARRLHRDAARGGGRRPPA